MSIKIRKTSSAIEAPLVNAVNALLDASLTTQKHRDKTSTPTGDTFTPTSTPLLVTGVTTDQTTCNALANEIKGILGFHFRDDSAHLIADTVNDICDGYADGYATTLAKCLTLANAEKADYNSHMAESGVHVNDDATNTVTAADADDLAKLKTLLADIKTQVNAHMANAGTVQRLVLVDP